MPAKSVTKCAWKTDYQDEKSLLGLDNAVSSLNYSDHFQEPSRTDFTMCLYFRSCLKEPVKSTCLKGQWEMEEIGGAKGELHYLAKGYDNRA